MLYGFLFFLFIANHLIGSPEIESMEKKLVTKVNEIRASYGLKALSVWKALIMIAREHSENMAFRSLSIGHGGFEERANKIHVQHPLKVFGENVAFNIGYTDPVSIACDGWMKSEAHKKNILGDYQETGIGVAITHDGKFYFTQLFASRKK